MRRTLQYILLVIGVVALIVLLVEIGLSLAATTHGSKPAKVVSVQAGPYPLTVKLYKDPANAGFALPFAVAPQHPVAGTLHYAVMSVPLVTPDATPVRAGISADSSVQNGIQGTAEITVKGTWQLEIVVTGPAGQGQADVPIEATALPPLPLWIGWPLGFIPLVGLFVFLLLLRRGKQGKEEERATESERIEQQTVL